MYLGLNKTEEVQIEQLGWNLIPTESCGRIPFDFTEPRPLSQQSQNEDSWHCTTVREGQKIKKKISIFKIQSSLHRKDSVELWAEIQHMVYSAQEMIDVTEFKCGMQENENVASF